MDVETNFLSLAFMMSGAGVEVGDSSITLPFPVSMKGIVRMRTRFFFLPVDSEYSLFDFSKHVCVDM